MTRIDDLTGKLLDGTLSGAEGAELDGLLAADATTARDHLALLDLEAALRGLRTDLDLDRVIQKSGPSDSIIAHF